MKRCGVSSDLILMVEHQSLRAFSSEAKAEVRVIPELGDVCQSQV